MLREKQKKRLSVQERKIQDVLLMKTFETYDDPHEFFKFLRLAALEQKSIMRKRKGQPKPLTATIEELIGHSGLEK